MMLRGMKQSVFDDEFQVKTICIGDLIGLKIQAIFNDPKNRYLIDAPDIQRLLSEHRDNLDLDIIREYFEIFGQERLFDKWLTNEN